MIFRARTTFICTSERLAFFRAAPWRILEKSHAGDAFGRL